MEPINQDNNTGKDGYTSTDERPYLEVLFDNVSRNAPFLQHKDQQFYKSTKMYFENNGCLSLKQLKRLKKLQTI